MSTYSDKLDHPKWQKRRLEVLEYARWRCQLCGDTETQLHCHHSYYQRNFEPWEYPEGSIIALCKNCHGIFHKNKGKVAAKALVKLTEEQVKERLIEALQDWSIKQIIVGVSIYEIDHDTVSLCFNSSDNESKELVSKYWVKSIEQALGEIYMRPMKVAVDILMSPKDMKARFEELKKALEL